jgi:hypothetical protein
MVAEKAWLIAIPVLNEILVYFYNIILIKTYRYIINIRKIMIMMHACGINVILHPATGQNALSLG